MPEKILIIGPAWVGDMVMAQSLFMTLKATRPGVELHVAAPKWSEPLLARMPEVDRSIGMDLAHGQLGVGARFKLGRTLAQEAYDQAILLPNSLKSALVPFFAGIPVRTGWRGESRYGLINDMRRLDKAALPLMVDRFNALAFDKDRIGAATDFPAPHPEPRLVRQDPAAALAQFGLAVERPVLALCPGAEFGPSKRWPETHYAESATRLLEEGHQVWIFGSAKDRAVGEAVIAAVPEYLRAQIFNLAGATTLGQAIDLLGLADAVISNDSGLMHVAAALDRPLVAVYGSTSPFFTPPLSSRASTVQLGIECSPCFKRECPLGHHRCMRELGADRVLAALPNLSATAS